MAQTTVSIRMDNDLKNNFDHISGDLSSYWSRRIDDANRIVYRIDGNVVKIVQCGSHYRDK
jgi:toxin YoeB